MLGAAGLIFGSVLAMRLLQPPAPAFDPQEAGHRLVTAASEIERLQARLKADPDNASAYAQLGLVMLQRVRENGDPALYIQAERAFRAALARNPDQLDALIGMGSLALSRHAFTEAIVWGERAKAINPFRAQVYGIIGDALVELGRYPEAAQAIQKMVDTRPDIASYTRVSYLRELHGDVVGAIDAMTRAAKAGAPGGEATLWAWTYLGHLHFNRGDLRDAEAAYTGVLQQQPSYPYAMGGLARIRAAQGRTDEAITLYQTVLDRLPLAQWAIELGELFEATGERDRARAQFELVRAIQRLNAHAAMNVDLEMALFEADHGDPATAVALARAAYERRPSIYGADALAWALHRAGQSEEAWPLAQKALRLGTRDALLHFHAGMIAAALDGRTSEAADLLRAALDINPHFSVRYAPMARRELARLDALTP